MNNQERIANYPIHESQRGYFGYYLYQAMANNEDIYILTGDLGYKLFDPHRDDFKDRFINCGAAEQTMLDMAVGLALKGKIPFVYSITPFLLSRGHETIRLYIDHEKIPVILIGSGRDSDYEIDGYSHDANDASQILENFPNVAEYWPSFKEEMPRILNEVIEGRVPAFISLSR
jgi:transketolase